ncbi:MAG: hypothetical protein Q9216_000872 [Gyalolechia sp. 2 TL-2023]
MSSILDHAEIKIHAEILGKGDVPLTPLDFPWIFHDSGLVLRATSDLWTWQLLSDAVAGLRYCAFRKGIFDEIDIVGVRGEGKRRSEGRALMSLTRQDSTESSNGYSAQCVVPHTTTVLKLSGSGRRIDSFAMGQLLDKAQAEVASRLSKGDRRFKPEEIPWIFSSNGLTIKAQLGGWSFRMLKNTIEGLRACPYANGVFEEILVTSVVDRRGIDPNGSRYLSLIRGPDPPEDVDAPRPFPTDFYHCKDADTRMRLIYQVFGRIDAYAMQQILDGAQADVKVKIVIVGEDYKLQPTETPWLYRSNGLVIEAEYEGWTWGFLNRTIAAVRNCAFRKGDFGEVYVGDVTAKDAPTGQRSFELKRLR